MTDSVDQTSGPLLLINGTIVSAKDFDSLNICICFYIESEKHWNFIDIDDSSFYGSTNKCLANSSDICFFSMPFQVCLKFNDKTDWTDIRPILYLKVLSFDYQNFLTSESFGSLQIPIVRGKYSFTVKTWKPFVGKRVEQMRQYFLGCAPVVHKMHTDSTQTQDKTANNYGIESETSGQIDMEFDIIMQTEKNGFHKIIGDKYKVVNPSVDSIKQNVLSVVLAFQRARRRMQALKGQLDSSFML